MVCKKCGSINTFTMGDIGHCEDCKDTWWKEGLGMEECKHEKPNAKPYLSGFELPKCDICGLVIPKEKYPNYMKCCEKKMDLIYSGDWDVYLCEKCGKTQSQD